jgi:hypothetical protein
MFVADRFPDEVREEKQETPNPNSEARNDCDQPPSGVRCAYPKLAVTPTVVPIIGDNTDHVPSPSMEKLP